jgi:ABC-type bacteriocin/lantibiotic exporter with double-glycine peptidase domain
MLLKYIYKFLLNLIIYSKENYFSKNDTNKFLKEKREIKNFTTKKTKNIFKEILYKIITLIIIVIILVYFWKIILILVILFLLILLISWDYIMEKISLEHGKFLDEINKKFKGNKFK